MIGHTRFPVLKESYVAGVESADRLAAFPPINSFLSHLCPSWLGDAPDGLADTLSPRHKGLELTWACKPHIVDLYPHLDLGMIFAEYQ
jgi:hypothetical protein